LIAGGDEQILMAVDHVGLRRVGDLADARVPKDFAVGGVIRNEVAADVSGEDEFAGSRENAVAAAEAAADAGVAMTPGNFAGFIVDGC